MPLYEYRKNAENSLPLPEETRKSITVGTAASCQMLLEQFAGATAAGALTCSSAAWRAGFCFHSSGIRRSGGRRTASSPTSRLRQYPLSTT